MRFTHGMFGIGLCLMSAVASAQTPAGATLLRRGASLLPPEPVHQTGPTIARAAAEELREPAMTPVARTREANSPAWLNGTDAGVRPAGGTVPLHGSPRPTTAKQEPTTGMKSFDKLKDVFGSGDRPAPQGKAPGGLPPGMAKTQPDASTAFRGTSTTGATVYAGPPAYRWYGWGSVTPGANPYAPTGQSPPASANWFSITGATPGAFPVPVASPYRQHTGTEPPSYIPVPNYRVASASAASMPAPAITMPAPASAVQPHTLGTPPSATIPPPADLSRVEPPTMPFPAPTPTITPPPPIVIPGPVMPGDHLVPGPGDPEPPIRPATAVPTITPLPPLNVIDATPAPTGPAPLPVSVTEDRTNWQSPNTQPSPGEWSPAGGMKRPAPDATAPEPNWGSLKRPAQSIARGQVGETQPEPAADLIRRVCDGRAHDVDIRWTGSKRLSVHIRCRTTFEADRLMREISARPELAPLQIDFTVIAR